VAETYYLNIEKRQSSNIITVAAAHNLRALGLAHGPNIDGRRTSLNRVLLGPHDPDEVVGMARALMQEAGVKLAANTVRLVEIVISLPASTGIDQDAFFEHATQWVERYFGVPVLSAVLHRDEQNPHEHFMLLPLRDGRMQGSDLIGGPAQLRGIQADFFEQVAQHHGLVRKAPGKRLSAACRGLAADSIIAALQANPALLHDPDMVVAMRAAFGEKPEPSMKVLNIELPKPVRKPKRKSASSFVATMTRPVKPDAMANHMVSTEPNPIRFAPKPVPSPKPIPAPIQCATMKETQTLSCVGFAFRPVVEEAEVKQLAGFDAGADEVVRRFRDAEQPTMQWSEELGEFITLPPPKPKQTVAEILSRVSKGVRQ
jgi:hypothetical protein